MTITNGESRYHEDPEDRRLVASVLGESLAEAVHVVRVDHDRNGPMGGRYSQVQVVFKRGDGSWGSAMVNIYDGAQCGVDVEQLLLDAVEDKAKAGRIASLVEQL